MSEENEQHQELIENRYEDLIQSLTGRILPNRYRIDTILSTNPFTGIYRTFNEKEEKVVTMRIFRTMFKNEEDYQFRRFKQEVKRLSSLNHTNIAKLLDCGLLEEGLPYIIEENVDGPTLAEVLVQQNRLAAAHVGLIFSQVGRAMHYAHEHGVVHETLKPSRILISETKEGDALVKIAGTGLLTLHNKLGMSLKTPKQKAKFIGTAAYMSPEQCYEGMEVDGRSDIYSIGCLMYESLSGQLPFMATDDQVLKMHLEMDPTPLDVVRKDLLIPKRLQNIIERCMEKDLTKRYQFVRDLYVDLERDRDPSQRDKNVILPEGLQKAEKRVKETKEAPFKLIGSIIGGIVALAILVVGGGAVFTMTSQIADNGLWKTKLDAGMKSFDEGNISEAGEKLLDALSEARKFPTPDIRLAQTLNDLAALNIVTGRYDTALENLNQALEIEEAVSKPDLAQKARSNELRSAIALIKGKTKEAEEHARQSVEIAERMTGEHTVTLYHSYMQLFTVLLAEHDMDGAKKTAEKIKAAFDKSAEILPMDVISGRKQALALLDQADKKYEDAEKGLQEVLGDRQEKCGLASLPSIETMLLIGKLYVEEKKYDKALKLLDAAYTAKQKALGESSPVMAELSLEIGQVYDAQKNAKETEAHYRQALEMAEKAWGKGNIETLPYLDGLAKFLRSHKQISAAEVYEIEALDIRHPERVSKLGKN